MPSDCSSDVPDWMGLRFEANANGDTSLTVLNGNRGQRGLSRKTTIILFPNHVGFFRVFISVD